VRRPKSVSEGTADSFSLDNAEQNANPGFKARKIGYPFNTNSRSDVNIDWTSEQEQRTYRGRVPAPGYDVNNPTIVVRVPNTKIILDKPSTVVPQTSHVPILTIIQPIDGSSVAAGTTITIEALAIEYPYMVELYVNNSFVESYTVIASEKGKSQRNFKFLYGVPLSYVGTVMSIELWVRGANTDNNGIFTYKSASTGNMIGVNKNKWDDYGTVCCVDYAINGYEIQTAPDFLFKEPSDKKSVVVNVI